MNEIELVPDNDPVMPDDDAIPPPEGPEQDGGVELPLLTDDEAQEE